MIKFDKILKHRLPTLEIDNSHNFRPTKLTMQHKIEQLRKIINLKVNNFQFSKTVSIPFRVHSFIEIMSLRMLDFSESAEILLETNHIIPAFSTLRVVFENVAVSNRLYIAVHNSIHSKVLPENFEDLLSKIDFGTRYSDDLPAINIMTQIVKLNKTYPGIQDFYETLCEYVHPNWDGVRGSYSELNEIQNKTEIRKILTDSHELTNWIKACFELCIGIHLEIHKNLFKYLPEFTQICENEIKNPIRSSM